MTDSLVEPCSHTCTGRAPLPEQSSESWRRAYQQHTWKTASDFCPNSLVNNNRLMPVFCKILCVFTAALTYLDSICKSSCMHLKWHEMQILKHGWCSLSLGCSRPLRRLSVHPPSHLGIFGKMTCRWHAQPGNTSRILSHCDTRAVGLSPELRWHKPLPLAEGARPQWEEPAWKPKPAHGSIFSVLCWNYQ